MAPSAASRVNASRRRLLTHETPVGRFALNLALVAILIFSLACTIPIGGAHAQIDPTNEDQVAAATVLIVALVVELEDGIPVREYWRVPLGSGVVVSADGLIITNSHVVDLTALESDVETEENSQGVDLEIEDAFLIYAVDGMGDDPNPRYSATKVIDNPTLDLAVLAVIGNERGLRLSRPVGADRSPVTLAPSGGVDSRDLVHIFGYPVFGREALEEIGGTTIDVVDGRVRSLETGPGIGNIERIHIDATVSQGSSGGAVVDENARLVGIMTEALGGAAGGSAAVAIPINRARTVLEDAGWVEPPPTSGATPDTDTPTATPEPTATPTPTPTPTPILPPPPNPVTPEDAARFTELLAARGLSGSVVGPLAGELIQEAGFSTVNGAVVWTTDFAASATFTNPADPLSPPWDFGFTFHRTIDSAQQIFIDSSGYWSYAPYPGGTLAWGYSPAYDATPGATNTLDLVVEGADAYFGVNGEFLARLYLPPPIASDVQVGSGYYAAFAQIGRAIPYADFQVWTPEVVSVLPPTPIPGTIETATGEIDESLAIGFQTLVLGSSLLPSTGPFSGELIEATPGQAPQFWAGVSVADFGAAVTFTNPDTTVGTADIGFEFHNDGNQSSRVILDSFGNVYAVVASQDSQFVAFAPTYDSTPGASNTLQLFVGEDGGFIGVNGEYVGSIDLPVGAAASDVSVGTAFFTEDFVQDRVTSFSEFRVWALD